MTGGGQSITHGSTNVSPKLIHLFFYILLQYAIDWPIVTNA